MTKTTTKLTEVVTTEESPGYKRQRMLEVRQIIANAVKNNQRVDQLGFTGTDIAHSQIALQELQTENAALKTTLKAAMRDAE